MRPHPATDHPDPLRDPAGWSELLHVHVPALYGAVARRVGPDRQLTEDLVQEAWLRAVASWSARGLPQDPGAWLRTAAFNLLRDHFKRRRPEALETEPAGPLGDEERARDERRARAAAVVQRGLAALPRASAELLAARHFDGRTLAALAAEARTSERAIEGRLRRARGALERALRRLPPHSADLRELFPE